MGNRTLVLLQNDHASDWKNDEALGHKIAHAMNHAMGKPGHPEARLDGYGAVVQCTHADTQTLAVIDCYQFHPLVYGTWRQGESQADRDVRLLKDAAETLGFRLVRKT